RHLLRGVQQDVQEPAFVVGRIVGQIRFDVLDGLRQDEQPVTELVELRAREDQLVLVEPSLGGPAPGLVVPLAAGALAVPAGAPRTRYGVEPAAAPAAPQ